MFTDFQNFPKYDNRRLMQRGDVIRVMNPEWRVWHYGIVYSVDFDWTQGWAVTVIDNSKTRSCVGFTALEDFRGGNSFVQLHRAANDWEVAAILERASSRLNHRYHVTRFNCEAFVNWVISGVEKSKQVEAGLLVALGALALGVALNAK